MIRGAFVAKVFDWIEERTGFRRLIKHACSERIPGGASLAYVFGSGLLLIFVSQVVTGVALALYYCPSPDHAHTSVAYMVKEVSSGSFLRGIHSYGASAMILILGFHVAQTFLFGSYKGRRELLWISGCVLAFLVFAMGFTGYLLPWDQKAYFATTVGTNIASEFPWVGDSLRKLLRGGNEVGGLTLSRFFVMHVFVLPSTIFFFVMLHVLLFRKAGPAGPKEADPILPSLKSEPFYPKQVFYDIGFGLLILVVLAWAALKVPASLGPVANPADTQYLPRPEWYFRPMFHWYRYFGGVGTVIGVIVIPAVFSLLFIFVPFLDRGKSRFITSRKIPIGIFGFVSGSIIALGFQSFREDARDPFVSTQLKRQEAAEKAYLNVPFKPIVVGDSHGDAPESADPRVSGGKTVFKAKSCNACHGENGVGTSAGVTLAGVAKKYNEAKLKEILRRPTQPMLEGGMSPVEATSEEVDMLIKYLKTL